MTGDGVFLWPAQQISANGAVAGSKGEIISLYPVYGNRSVTGGADAFVALNLSY